MSADNTIVEARRVLGICNTCGYCNGFCDLFAAAQRRPALPTTDLAHLANLCHGCRNCLYACQYAAPHPFAVNVPRALADMRQHSYAEYVWPRAGAGLLARSGWTALLLSGGAIALLVGLVWLTVPSEIIFATHSGEGAFYRLFPWWTMALIGVLPLSWSTLAIGISLRRYWRATRPPQPIAARHLWRALHDVLILRNLRGGGPGCNDIDGRFSRWRRWLHQTLLAGLLSSFAATLVATIYHHFLDWQAPYPPLSLPVVLGTGGGLAMMVAVVGLIALKWREDRTPTDPRARTADQSFLFLLLLVAATGLALLIWRDTSAMGLLLAVHLGSVLAFFLILPYCKAVHAGYRLLALLTEALEREASPRV